MKTAPHVNIVSPELKANPFPLLSRLRGVFKDAGFTNFRRATEAPFNLIFEARK